MSIDIKLLLLGLTLLVIAVSFGGYAWLLLWPVINLLLVGMSGLFSQPRLLGKQDDGKFHVVVSLLFLPYRLTTNGLWHLSRIMTREPAYDEVSPKLFIGRRLLRSEIPESVDHIVDLTAELAAPTLPANVTYHLYPIVDGGVPTQDELYRWLYEIQALPGVVYLHCALGHGRTALVSAALWWQQNPKNTIAETVQHLRWIRPGLHMNPRQKKFLRKFETWIQQYRNSDAGD